MAKLSSFPYWPATITLCPSKTHMNKYRMTKGGKPMMWVSFYNENSGAWCNADKLRVFRPGDNSAYHVKPNHQLYQSQVDAITMATQDYYRMNPAYPRPDGYIVKDERPGVAEAAVAAARAAAAAAAAAESSSEEESDDAPAPVAEGKKKRKRPEPTANAKRKPGPKPKKPRPSTRKPIKHVKPAKVAAPPPDSDSDTESSESNVDGASPTAPGGDDYAATANGSDAPSPVDDNSNEGVENDLEDAAHAANAKKLSKAARKGKVKIVAPRKNQVGKSGKPVGRAPARSGIAIAKLRIQLEEVTEKLDARDKTIALLEAKLKKSRARLQKFEQPTDVHITLPNLPPDLPAELPPAEDAASQYIGLSEFGNLVSSAERIFNQFESDCLTAL
jgi:PWWP domain